MNTPPNNFAFIDSQNLKLGVSRDLIDKKSNTVVYNGWTLDYRKFRLYLKNKYNVTKAYLFIGLVPGNETMYRSFQEMGYIIVFKPTMPINNNGVRETKGNVDAELVLYASALTYDKYDQAVIVSGDGDFHCLVEYLDAEGKLLKILAPNIKFSSLLRKYSHKIVTVGTLRNTLEYKNHKKRPIKKTGISGRSKP